MKELTTAEFQESPFKVIGKDWFLVTAKSNNKVNTMTASWGGMGVMWGKDVVYVVIRPQRYTKEFIDGSNTFSLTVMDNSYRDKLNYFGKVSGRNEDKINISGLEISEELNTPYFKDGKYVFICKKLYAQEMNPDCFLSEGLNDKWYLNKDYHTLYIAEIEKILVKE